MGKRKQKKSVKSDINKNEMVEVDVMEKRKQENSFKSDINKKTMEAELLKSTTCKELAEVDLMGKRKQEKRMEGRKVPVEKSEVGGVVFTCTKDTILECLMKRQIVLHDQHDVCVKLGLPLFLYNLGDRRLYGLFGAARGSNASHCHIQFDILVHAQPLHEDEYNPILPTLFRISKLKYFELNKKEAHELIFLFEPIRRNTTLAKCGSTPLGREHAGNLLDSMPGGLILSCRSFDSGDDLLDLSRKNLDISDVDFETPIRDISSLEMIHRGQSLFVFGTRDQKLYGVFEVVRVLKLFSYNEYKHEFELLAKPQEVYEPLKKDQLNQHLLQNLDDDKQFCALDQQQIDELRSSFLREHKHREVYKPLKKDQLNQHLLQNLDDDKQFCALDQQQIDKLRSSFLRH